MRLHPSDEGQMHTVEGVVAALILVFVILYITGAVNLVSPQTEKASVMKLSIVAEDTLTVIGTIDMPANYSSVLLRDITAWQGHEGSSDAAIDAGEPSIQGLNDEIAAMQSPNVLYNLYVSYWDATTGQIETKTLIYNGDPQLNGVTASKKLALNDFDLKGQTQSFWYDIVEPDLASGPRIIEVQLVMWSI